MVNISRTIEKIIAQKPFLQEALSKGIINNAALAQKLIPEIEKEMKNKVKFSAVNMALRRLGERLKESFIERTFFDKDSRITMNSNLFEITVLRQVEILEGLKELYDIVDFNQGDFLTVTQSLYEVMVIAQEKYQEKILKLFPKKYIKHIFPRLSSLTIIIPLSSLETRGLFYIITRALTWENINITDIVSTTTEMTIILSEDDAPRAYSVLQKLLREHQKLTRK